MMSVIFAHLYVYTSVSIFENILLRFRLRHLCVNRRQNMLSIIPIIYVLSQGMKVRQYSSDQTPLVRN